MKRLAPPTSIDTLRQRATAIAGLTLAELAQHLNIPMPETQTRGKGFTGQLLELALGADAGSDAEPDFTKLHIELKTLPIDTAGKPLETTFVCSIPLLQIAQECWLTSTVYRKMQHVLWIPIRCEHRRDLATRRIGAPLLWRPTARQAEILETDWTELTDMIALGQLANVTARQGTSLHIRPKGANAKSLTFAIDDEGHKVQTLSRGFYLRPTFTGEILQGEGIDAPITQIKEGT